MNQQLKAHFALVIVNLVYGANYVIAKEVTPEYILPFGFILMRVTTGVLVFWLLSMLLKRFSPRLQAEKIERKDFLAFAYLGLFGVAINQLMFFKGLSMTSPIHASLIMITTPITVLIVASFLIKERITWLKALGILFGAAGAVLIILYGHQGGGSSVSSVQGDIFIYINASSYALYVVLVKPLMSRYHPLTIIKWVFTFGLIYVLPFSWGEFQAIEWHTFTNSTWLGVAYVLLLTTCVTYLFNIYALQTLNASTVGAYIYTQPVIATIIAISLGKDALSSLKLLAAALIFTGVFLVSYRFRERNG